MKLEQALKSNKFKNEVHKAALNILYTSWWLKTLMSQELKLFGLTHEQYNVLRILKGKYPEQMCVKDIASRMIEKSSNVPRIIDRLESKSWAIRTTSQEDKRETLITLTPHGIDVLAQSTQRIDEVFSNNIDLKEENAAVLNSLLEELREKE
ncbi:MAG: MarR family winged helix-turn-helix transcriptional regulator [Chitinophagaceae bacterium]